jgi:hypothetical protein
MENIKFKIKADHPTFMYVNTIVSFHDLVPLKIELMEHGYENIYTEEIKI